MELLRDLHREGATICMVTHDPRFARHAERQSISSTGVWWKRLWRK